MIQLMRPHHFPKHHAHRVCLFAILLIFLFQSVSLPATIHAAASQEMTILFTSDLHDQFYPMIGEQNGRITSTGGYARLQSAILAEREKNPGLLLLDAGDYSMGTPFQTLYETDAAELRIMGLMGYDVLTFGNHEYDYHAEGLANSLNTARKSGDRLPSIVQANILFPTDKAGRMTPDLSSLMLSMEAYGVREYTVIERNGVKTGIFGLMGATSADNAPNAAVQFTDVVEGAKRIVKVLQEQEKVDLIVCLSHSGLWTDPSKSEDEILARKVPEIDVLISGHTHTTLAAPIVVGHTLIVACGANSANLGKLKITRQAGQEWKLDRYQLKQIDANLLEDATIAAAIETYRMLVQSRYFDKFNVRFEDVLAQTAFSFKPLSAIVETHVEEPLGNLISDAFRYAIQKAEGDRYEEIAATIVPIGTMYYSFVKGNITVADAFTASPLGVGRDKLPGYPLITAYLTGKELKTLCEVDASIAPMMPTDVQLFFSGMQFTFNPNRLIFNKVTEASLVTAGGKITAIDDKKLYRIAAGLFSAQMLPVIGKESFGLLPIVPKTKDGKVMTDFEAHIVKNTTAGSKNEVKEWLAIAEYLQSFALRDGIPQVPDAYRVTQGRKVVSDSHRIVDLLARPNTIALAAYAIVLVLLMLVFLIIFKIVFRLSRRTPRQKR